MFQRHVSGRIAALVNGEMRPSDAARVQAHLDECARCHDARDRHVFAAGMMRELAVVEAPASIWAAIERTLDVAPPKTDLKVRRYVRSRDVRSRAPLGARFVMQPVWALAAVITLAVASVVFWQINRAPRAWDVTRLEAPTGAGRMGIGEWIETDAASRAIIKIGEIGTVEIEPNTRMQLLTARKDEHRLNLAHGTISAQILAPPRLFFVETPSSTVVDLGCAYTMTVDQAGAGMLRVTSGWASLEWGGLESIVPAGASCPTRPSVGPGTPSFDDSTARMKEALLAFDYNNGGSAALDAVLAEARDRDTLTLWHLLSRVDAAERPRIFDRMIALTPLPPGVTREKALALDAETLKLWREELAWTW